VEDGVDDRMDENTMPDDDDEADVAGEAGIVLPVAVRGCILAVRARLLVGCLC